MQISFRCAPGQLLRIEQPWIIEAPLYDIDGVDDGRFARWQAAFDGALLAAFQVYRPQCIGEVHRSIEHRQHRCAVVGYPQLEFSAPDGSVGRRGDELRFILFRSSEKIKAALFQFRCRFGLGTGGRFQADGGQFVDTQDAAVGQLDGRPAG